MKKIKDVLILIVQLFYFQVIEFEVLNVKIEKNIKKWMLKQVKLRNDKEMVRDVGGEVVELIDVEDVDYNLSYE